MPHQLKLGFFLGIPVARRGARPVPLSWFAVPRGWGGSYCIPSSSEQPPPTVKRNSCRLETPWKCTKAPATTNTWNSWWEWNCRGKQPRSAGAPPGPEPRSAEVHSTPSRARSCTALQLCVKPTLCYLQQNNAILCTHTRPLLHCRVI